MEAGVMASCLVVAICESVRELLRFGSARDELPREGVYKRSSRFFCGAIKLATLPWMDK